tara:strand:+ start:11021 stop:11233 length:213 start_codon:yes stop_codon:yes gene_type:complete
MNRNLFLLECVLLLVFSALFSVGAVLLFKGGYFLYGLISVLIAQSGLVVSYTMRIFYTLKKIEAKNANFS